MRLELGAVPEGRNRLTRAYEDFLPLNHRLQRACTEWQLRPSAVDPLAFNDHTDAGWDDRVLEDLYRIAVDLAAVESDLVSVLPRFRGYDARFLAAYRRHRVDGPHDSCHAVWFQLHEDLLATLGRRR